MNATHLGELTEHEGKLAQYRGEGTKRSNGAYLPVHQTHLAVSNLKLDDYLRSLLGKVPYAVNGGWSGYVSNGARDVMVLCDDWGVVTIETPIPAPRDRRTSTWEWAGNCSGEWRKREFPLCPECGTRHTPAIIYCQMCYRCHRGPCKDR